MELPAELLAQNAEYQMNQLRQRLRKSKMTMELYCKSAGLTPEQVREGYRKEAERQLRAMLAVRAIAEAEKITVTQQEVDARSPAFPSCTTPRKKRSARCSAGTPSPPP